MRKLVIFSILLSLAATPVYAKGHSSQGGGSSHSGGSHSSSANGSSDSNFHTNLGPSQNQQKTAPNLDNKVEASKTNPKLTDSFEKTGDLDSDIESAEQAVKSNFNNVDTLKTLGQLYEKAGKKELKTFVNGVHAHFDVPPVIKDGRTIIPIRGISESLKADVSWDSETQSITIVRNGTTIVLTIGSNVATVDGQSVSLDSQATLLNGRAFVPLRFVSEILKAKVDWIQDGEIINVSDEQAETSNENTTEGTTNSSTDTTSNSTETVGSVTYSPPSN